MMKAFGAFITLVGIVNFLLFMVPPHLTTQLIFGIGDIIVGGLFFTFLGD